MLSYQQQDGLRGNRRRQLAVEELGTGRALVPLNQDLADDGIGQPLPKRRLHGFAGAEDACEVVQGRL